MSSYISNLLNITGHGRTQVSWLRRLVVAALKKPGPMQRHRDEKIGATENFAAGAAHPASKSGDQMSAVPMLQPEHEAAAVFVVAQHRPRPVPAMPVARAGAARRILADRMRKRQTARRTPRRAKKGDAAPASAFSARKHLFRLKTRGTLGLVP